MCEVMRLKSGPKGGGSLRGEDGRGLAAEGGRGGPDDVSGRSRRKLERLARLATEGRGLDGMDSP